MHFMSPNPSVPLIQVQAATYFARFQALPTPTSRLQLTRIAAIAIHILPKASSSSIALTARRHVATASRRL